MDSDALIGQLTTRRRLPPPATRRAIRVAAGATQDDVAAVVRVHRETISRWESGRREPRRLHLVRYIEILENLRLIGEGQ
jgi:DNA-binding XRE family transcriptional regulator